MHFCKFMHTMQEGARKRLRVDSDLSPCRNGMDCSACTFVNSASAKVCEVCGCELGKVTLVTACSKCGSLSTCPDLGICLLCEQTPSKDLREPHRPAPTLLASTSSTSAAAPAASDTADVTTTAVSVCATAVEHLSTSSDGLICAVDRVLMDHPASSCDYGLCTPCVHISQKGTEGAGWSCGYRNIQMMSDALMRLSEGYQRTLYQGTRRVPDIAGIQTALEDAWRRGFDAQVSEHDEWPSPMSS